MFPAAALVAPIPAAGSTTQRSIPVSALNIPPAEHRLSEARLRAIVDALPKVRAVRAEHPGYATVIVGGGPDVDVQYFAPNKREIAMVVINPSSGRVLEQWTGFQLKWAMARGYPGYFGNHVNAVYIWLPLCLLFMLPFFNFRRPFSLLHLDMLVLLSFSISLAFFNHGRIDVSVPLVYPPLIYLLVRMLTLMHRQSRPEAIRLLVPTSWLVLGVVLLIGFRIALNVTDSNVTDVGHAGVIGAQRIVEGKPLYGSYPQGHEHADTYGPVNYEAYIPFEQVFGPSDPERRATHAAAIVFDLLAVALLFLIGRRTRGPTLGIALAYAWVSYPFTLFALESNTNDALVAALVLAALLAATYRSEIARCTRGAFAALAGLAKFAPLALAPLLATHGLRELSPARRPRALVLFLAGFLATAALVAIPALSHASVRTIFDETLAFQANRRSPFSVWGLYGGLGALQLSVQVVAVMLALGLAVVPRRPDLVGLAAACAAVIVGMQLGLTYWFYFYIPWFFPLAMLALLGDFSVHRGGPQTTARGAV